MTTPSNRAIALHSAVVLVALLASGLVALSLGSSARQPAVPTPGAFAAMLQRAGLGSQALAAAGLTPALTTAAIERVREQLPRLASQLDAADAAYSQAFQEHDRLAWLVRSGTATSEDVAALRTAAAQLAAAAADLDAALLAVLEEAELAPEAAATVAAIQQAHDQGWEGLPVPYRVVTRAEGEWLTLRQALASRDIHTRLDESVPQEATRIILTADADPAVAAAQASLDANGSAVTAAWNRAVYQE